MVFIGVLAWIGLFFLESLSHGTAAAPNYNILMIVVDDLRPALRCYDDPIAQTLHIDQLAQRSLVFDKAYCQMPICMPSRASMLSGLHAQRGHQKLRALARPGEHSLPGWFKKNGYETVSIGKIYHFPDDDEASWSKLYGGSVQRRHANGELFDEVVPGYKSGYQLSQSIGLFIGNQTWPASPSFEIAAADDAAYPDHLIARSAVEELYRCAKLDRPFFLAVGFYRPHLPWTAPQQDWDLFDPRRVGLPEIRNLPPDCREGRGPHRFADLRSYGDIKSAGQVVDDAMTVDRRRAYYATVSFVDRQIGLVLGALKKHGLSDNTIVCLWSDHGYHLGEQGCWSKCKALELSLRVPLMIAHPQGQGAGHRTGALAGLIDLYPTMCDLTDLDKPDHLQGVSLARLLKQPDTAVRDAVFHSWIDVHSIRTDRNRLNFYPADNQVELYEYSDSLIETDNLAGRPDQREVIENLKLRLLKEMKTWRK